MMMKLVLLHMLRLHTPDGQEIAVNPDTVVTLREPRATENYFPKGTRCVINMADGKFNLVAEDCITIRTMLEEIQE
jgi:hypothetical protein